jgi:hypothetical protein
VLRHTIATCSLRYNALVILHSPHSVCVCVCRSYGASASRPVKWRTSPSCSEMRWIRMRCTVACACECPGYICSASRQKAAAVWSALQVVPHNGGHLLERLMLMNFPIAARGCLHLCLCRWNALSGVYGGMLRLLQQGQHWQNLSACHEAVQTSLGLGLIMLNCCGRGRQCSDCPLVGLCWCCHHKNHIGCVTIEAAHKRNVYSIGGLITLQAIAFQHASDVTVSYSKLNDKYQHASQFP